MFSYSEFILLSTSNYSEFQLFSGQPFTAKHWAVLRSSFGFSHAVSQF